MDIVNIESIKIVVKGLEELANKVVFVGGSVVGLYASNQSLSDVRPTMDIDCIIDIAPKSKFPEFEEQLRAKGFRNDIKSGVICRWIYNDITVDIMPTDEAIMGFTNIWYKEGMANAQLFKLDDSTHINIFTTPYFLASKFEALYGRSNRNDMRYNSDFEDIVYIIENRDTIIEEIRDASDTVRTYLKNKFSNLLNDDRIEEYIEAVINDRSDENNKYVKEVMQQIASLS